MSEIDIFKVEVSDQNHHFYSQTGEKKDTYNSKIIIIPKLGIDLLYLPRERDIIPKFNKYIINAYMHTNNISYYYIKIEPNIQKMLINDDEYGKRIATQVILNKLKL